MTDPWKVLGVRQGSSDDEVKKAYRNLVKKYHPDRFQDTAAKELANEKLKEINEAYEAITSGGVRGGQSGGGSAGFGDFTASGSQAFRQVRTNLQMRRVDEAERILDQMSERNAEWHFLRGVCYSYRGWYAMARENIAQAVNLEPANAEYQTALAQLDNSGQGFQQYGSPFGRNRGGVAGTGMSTCDMCTCAICSDCCCESMGGDCIPCC
jgi:molecular chaperone DnaJ